MVREGRGEQGRGLPGQWQGDERLCTRCGLRAGVRQAHAQHLPQRVGARRHQAGRAAHAAGRSAQAHARGAAGCACLAACLFVAACVAAPNVPSSSLLRSLRACRSGATSTWPSWATRRAPRARSSSTCRASSRAPSTRRARPPPPPASRRPLSRQGHPSLLLQQLVQGQRGQAAHPACSRLSWMCSRARAGAGEQRVCD